MKQVLLCIAVVISGGFVFVAAVGVCVGVLNEWTAVAALGCVSLVSGTWVLASLVRKLKRPSSGHLRASGLRYVQK